MFEVERWNRDDYPSHWEYEASFKTLDEAIAWMNEQGKSDRRIIIDLTQTD